MSSRKPVTDDELSEYVDGGLSEERRSEIAAWLLENPKKAAEVGRLRQLNDALRRLGTEILDEPVPDRLRDVVRRARSGSRADEDDSSGGRSAGRRSGSGSIEVLVVCAILGLGAGLGWAAEQSLVERERSAVGWLTADAGDDARGRQGVPL